ncbi:unnamed protein product, partial [Ectocarpus sp. 8 AP-2014]
CQVSVESIRTPPSNRVTSFWARPSNMLLKLRWQGVASPSTTVRDSEHSKSYRKTPRRFLKRVGGCQQSGPHSRLFLALVMSATVVGIAESTMLVDLSSGFKCAWYNLSHPVQFAVLLVMPALFFGVNRMFGMLDKAAYARLSRAVSAWMNEKRQVDQI